MPWHFMEIRENNLGVHSLLLPSGSQGSNPSSQGDTSFLRQSIVLEPRLALNLQSFCLCFPCNWLTSLNNQADMSLHFPLMSCCCSQISAFVSRSFSDLMDTQGRVGKGLSRIPKQKVNRSPHALNDCQPAIRIPILCGEKKIGSAPTSYTHGTERKVGCFTEKKWEALSRFGEG